MSVHSKAIRHQSPEHRKVAETYAARIMFGKLVLALSGGAALAVVFLLGTARSVAAAAALVVAGSCFVSIFLGDFPAWARCPVCGRKMRVRTSDEKRVSNRHRRLFCPHCNETVALDDDQRFRKAP